MSFRKSIVKQFGLPRDALGHVVGWMMAHAGPNADRSSLWVNITTRFFQTSTRGCLEDSKLLFSETPNPSKNTS